MMRWIDAWNELATVWAEVVWRASWQGAAFLLVVFVLCRVSRGLSAGARCWLWRLAALKLLVGFVWIAPVALPIAPAASLLASVGDRSERVEPIAIPVADSVSTPVVAPAAQVPTPRPLAWLMVAWIVGVVITVVRYGLDVRAVRWMVRQATPVEDATVLRWVRELSSQLGVRRPVRVKTVPGIDGPAVTGIRRPTILLPAGACAAAPTPSLRLALAHELAHVARGDLVWNWVYIAVDALYFFHPLVRVLRHRWRLHQEMACDETALTRTGADPAEYGALLLAMAACVGPHGAPPLAMVARADDFSTIRRRLIMLQRIRPKNRMSMLVGGAIIAIACAAIVPIRITAQADAEEPAPPVAVRPIPNPIPQPTPSARPAPVRQPPVPAAPVPSAIDSGKGVQGHLWYEFEMEISEGKGPSRKIVSRPTLRTLPGQQAFVQIGQIPQVFGSGERAERVDPGWIISLLPMRHDDRSVLVDVRMERVRVSLPTKNGNLGVWETSGEWTTTVTRKSGVIEFGKPVRFEVNPRIGGGDPWSVKMTMTEHTAKHSGTKVSTKGPVYPNPTRGIKRHPPRTRRPDADRFRK